MQFRKQQPQLVCPDHHNETITNYCSSLDCLKPLCPECMFPHNQHHRQKHTYPEIESIKGITTSSQTKLKDASHVISRELANLDNSIHQP